MNVLEANAALETIDPALKAPMRPIGAVACSAAWRCDDTSFKIILPAGTLIERVIQIESDRVFLQTCRRGLRYFAWIPKTAIGWFKNIPQIDAEEKS